MQMWNIWINSAKLHSGGLDIEIFLQDMLQNLTRRDRSVPALVAKSDAHNLRFIANWRFPPAIWRLLPHTSGCLFQLLQGFGKEGLEMFTFNESFDVVWMEAQMVLARACCWVVEPKLKVGPMIQAGQCAKVLSNILFKCQLWMIRLCENDFNNHIFVQGPKNAKVNAAMSAGIKYKPHLKQLPYCSCNQANGPCSRTDGPLWAHDV